MRAVLDRRWRMHGVGADRADDSGDGNLRARRMGPLSDKLSELDNPEENDTDDTISVPQGNTSRSHTSTRMPAPAVTTAGDSELHGGGAPINETSLMPTTSLTIAPTASLTTVTSTATSTLTSTTITTTLPVDWMSWIGRAYYINLPPTDNWSMYGPVRTVWTKLRIIGTPHLGATTVDIDLHDWSFSVSNGEKSLAHNLTQIEWGISGDCRGSPESEMRVNLLGTPFAYEAEFMSAGGEEAHGSVSCSQSDQYCQGSCGGWCGYCGLGAASETSTATLTVIDRSRYDAALLDMYGDATEALKTTTRTSSTRTTSRTSTSTTITHTSTPISDSAMARTFSFLASDSTSSGQSSSVAGIVVFMLFLVGAGVLLAVTIRRGIFKQIFARRYGRFDEENPSKKSRVPPQPLGGSEPLEIVDFGI